MLTGGRYIQSAQTSTAVHSQEAAENALRPGGRIESTSS